MSTNKAIVLAAGKGTRMMPLTADRPKHMIPVNGRPFIDYIIKSLKAAGIDQIALVVNYKKEALQLYVRENYPDIVFIEQNEPKGTGHAVLSAMDFVDNDDFIVIMGDNLYSSNDIRGVVEGNDNVVAGYMVDDPSKYGVLVVDGDKLISMIEKPQNPPSNLINTGLYKFTSDIFPALKNVKLSVRGEYELPDAINMLAKTGNVRYYKLRDYWLDFGKPEDVPKMEEFLKSKM